MTGDSWKITLPCSKAVAERLAGDVPELADLETPPVLMTREPDPARPDDWLLEAYLDAEPDGAMQALLLGLVPDARAADMHVEHVPAADWVTLSQDGLEPITAGRFHVYTARHAGTLRPGQIGLLIEAGQAFGTGQHETTAGCLTMIDGLAEAGFAVADAVDLGTGTAILALAIAKRWPQARVLATDIDPVAIEVSAENVTVNGERVGGGPGEIGLAVADGTNHPEIAARAPYQLVVANILAGPLIEMAGGIAPLVAPGGRLLLAGLLQEQAAAVAAAYAANGLRLVARHDAGDWPTLMLTRDEAR
jgi:ribosomal protein L11 methyltransferase